MSGWITGEPRTGVGRRTFLGLAGSGAVASIAGCLARGESSDLEGAFSIDGSNTVLPHSATLAQEFMWRNNRVGISVSGAGTGAGFQRFCNGETTIQNASRAVTDGERESCRAGGWEFLELTIATDGIVVMKHPDNDWVDCLTREELGRIWERDSAVERWSDLDSAWPDEPIDLYGRDSASGTFDYFTEHLTGEAGNIRQDYSSTPDTNVIVRGVRGNQYALGFGGAGYYFANEDDLATVAVDDDDGCVSPTRETIEGGAYTPLARPLYLYLRTDRLATEEVRAFARFYFSEVDEAGYEQADEFGLRTGDERLTWTQWAARRVGLFAIDDDAVDAAGDRLEDAIAEVT